MARRLNFGLEMAVGKLIMKVHVERKIWFTSRSLEFDITDFENSL